MLYHISVNCHKDPLSHKFDRQYEAESIEKAKEMAMTDLSPLLPSNIQADDVDLKIEEIIEFDSDTDSLENSEGIPSNGLYPYDPNYKVIEIDEQPSSIYEYLRQLNKGNIIIQPEFQRNKVWNEKQKSQFIESVILNFPLPPIYLNQNKDNKYIVIDGLQRTSTLTEYFNNKFALSSLEALPDYNGMKFADLPDTLQSKLEDKKLIIFSLKPSTPLTVIYDLFKRINTGGTQLNRQEVRNCIFYGKSTKLLKELAASTEFKKAIDNGVSPKRMKDREIALRYLSFRWKDPATVYDGDMSKFLENTMRRINSMTDMEIQKIKEDFKLIMSRAYRLWGKNCFRIPTRQTRGLVNTAVLESVCLYLSKISDSHFNANIDRIRDNYHSLIKNKEYIDSVTSATASKQNVSTRFALAERILEQYNQLTLPL